MILDMVYPVARLCSSRQLMCYIKLLTTVPLPYFDRTVTYEANWISSFDDPNL